MKTECIVYKNANIYTMRGRERVQALAVCFHLSKSKKGEGRILAVGSNREILSLCKSLKPQIIDLDGMTVFPGFTDSHIHFCGWALQSIQLNLDGLNSLAACVNKLDEKVKRTTVGDWIVGGGWNKNVWGDGPLPHASDLDAVSPHTPVALSSKDWHTLWLNTRALELLGIDKNTPDVPGGVIERDASGKPTGLLRENSVFHYLRSLPAPSEETYAEAFRWGQKRLANWGITGFHAMDTIADFEMYQKMKFAGRLLLRAVVYLPAVELDSYVRAGLRTGFGDARLKVGGIKIFGDGSLGSQSAFLLSPYENSTQRGILAIAPELLRETVRHAAAHGLACAVHAIGDATNRLVLDAFSEARSLDLSLRHRIEHCQLVHPDDFKRFGELKLIASVQPTHCPSDLDLIERYWGARGAYAYAFRSLLKSGAVLAFGSDAPVESPNPWQALHAAITRQRHPADRPSFVAQEKLLLWQALRAYTIDAAFAAGDDEWKGSLEAGKVADFFCLAEDPFTQTADALPGVKPVMTVVGGRPL